MSCTAYSSQKGEKLQCTMIQTAANIDTITICVKRQRIDDSNTVDHAASRAKRFKAIVDRKTGNATIYKNTFR